MPPALRIMWASPGCKPRQCSKRMRESMQARTATCRLGRTERSPRLKLRAKVSLAFSNSSATDKVCAPDKIVNGCISKAPLLAKEARGGASNVGSVLVYPLQSAREPRRHDCGDCYACGARGDRRGAGRRSAGASDCRAYVAAEAWYGSRRGGFWGTCGTIWGGQFCLLSDS